MSAALTRTMGDHELLKLLMAEFGKSYAGAVAMLARLLAGGAMGDLATKAHDLKGVAANLGAGPLAKAAEALQKAAESGDAGKADAACREIARLLPPTIAEADRIAGKTTEGR